MSVEATSWVWRNYTRGGTEKLVMLAIADHADRYGRNAWPSIATIAEYAAVDVRTAQRSLTRLESQGDIMIARQQGGTSRMRGDRRPNLYMLAKMPAPEEAVDGVTFDLHGVTVDLPRGDTATPPERPLRTSTRTTPLSADAEKASEEIQALCNLLAELVATNGARRPRITSKWLTEARLLVERDGHEIGEVAEVIRWCQQDSFWKSNVMAMPKFRQRYDQLAMKMRATREPQRSSNGVMRPAQTSKDHFNAGGGFMDGWRS